MRTFKYLFLFIVSAIAQNNEIKILSLEPVKITSTLDSILDKQLSLSLEYHLKSYDIHNNNSSYYIIDSYKIADSLILFSHNQLREQVEKQILRPFIKIPIGRDYYKVGESLVSKYYFINKTPRFEFGLLGKQDLGALISLKPNFNSLFAGAFGLSQNNKKLNVIGELDIDIENFTGNAEQIEVLWKKNNSLSQKIKLGTFVPYLFGTGIGIFWQFDHEFYNGLYTKSERKFMFHAYLPILNSLQVGYNKGKILATNLGKNSGYKDVDFLAISLRSELDTRNDRLLPVSGKFFNMMIDGGVDGKYIFIKTDIKYQVFLHVLNNTYAKFQTVINGISYPTGLIPKSRYFNLGGASSLRGFDEKAFIFTQYQILTFELINQQKSPLQIKSFIDLGSNKFNISENTLFGYGIGLNQVNEKSIVSVEYSLGSNHQRGGKIHVKWSTRF